MGDPRAVIDVSLVKTVVPRRLYDRAGMASAMKRTGSALFMIGDEAGMLKVRWLGQPRLFLSNLQALEAKQRHRQVSMASETDGLGKVNWRGNKRCQKQTFWRVAIECMLQGGSFAANRPSITSCFRDNRGAILRHLNSKLERGHGD